jgi:hypothetical protein
MVKVIVAQDKIDCEHLVGTFLNDSHYDVLVNEDTDCYIEPGCSLELKTNCDTPPDCGSCAYGTTEKKVAFKFRKNYFTQEEQDEAYWGLRDAARETENRGLASGILEGHFTEEGKVARAFVTNYQHDMLEAIDEHATQEALIDECPIERLRKQYPTFESRMVVTGNGKHTVWVYNRFIEQYPDFKSETFDKYVDEMISMTKAERHERVTLMTSWISTSTYGNKVRSGITGWFDRYPRIPFGRATSYTRDRFEDFSRCYPFMQRLAKGFKDLLPKRFAAQSAAADRIDQRFRIPGTPFTTITVNSTFRTAAHRDAGDFADGMSNLLVVSNGGNYTGGYLVFPEYRIAVNVRPGDLLLVNNHEIIHGNTPFELLTEDAERLSLVVYLREGMLELGSYDYERCREDFVESRRLDPTHPAQRYKWNGITPGMWESPEWYQYCQEHLGREVLLKYHPNAEKGASLEEFF